MQREFKHEHVAVNTVAHIRPQMPRDPRNGFVKIMDLLEPTEQLESRIEEHGLSQQRQDIIRKVRAGTLALVVCLGCELAARTLHTCVHCSSGGGGLYSCFATSALHGGHAASSGTSRPTVASHGGTAS